MPRVREVKQRLDGSQQVFWCEAILMTGEVAVLEFVAAGEYRTDPVTGLPHGSTGELVVRGSHVMRGYWQRPEETRERLRPGPIEGESVLHTGDLFRSDADGYLYFVARKDDIIKTRGEKVSPREVENALYELAGVAEAAVLGIPDAVLGQAVKAVLTLRDGAILSEQEVRRHCAQRLENFMVPTVVEFRTEMPKTSSGKIDKKPLQTTAVA